MLADEWTTGSSTFFHYHHHHCFGPCTSASMNYLPFSGPPLYQQLIQTTNCLLLSHYRFTTMAPTCYPSPPDMVSHLSHSRDSHVRMTKESAWKGPEYNSRHLIKKHRILQKSHLCSNWSWKIGNRRWHMSVILAHVRQSYSIEAPGAFTTSTQVIHSK